MRALATAAALIAIAGTCTAASSSGVSSVATARQTPAAPVGAAAATGTDYTFPTGAGILFFYVKPDRTTDFELVIARLSDALAKTSDPLRQQQAATWRILRSADSIKDAAVYVFVFTPAVTGADYDPVRVLSDTLPGEANGLYAKLKDSLIRVERMGLVTLR